MTKPALTFDGVSVLRSGSPVTHDVSFDVERGGVTVLVGPNGAGKSSLVLAASGVLDATGSIRAGGNELIGRSPDAIRRLGVAAVPEGHHVLTGLTAMENLAVAARGKSKSEARRQVEPVLEVLPELIDVLDRKGGDLSGGQQQMLSIGQALVCEPDVLLIDELSLGLAPIIVSRLLDALVTVGAAGTSVLLIEQFTERALEIAATAHVISSGHLTYSGDAETLQRNPSIIEAAYLTGPETTPKESA